MAQPDPLREFRRIQLRYDAETRAILERTARGIRSRIGRITGTGIGAQVRRSQLTLVLREVEGLLQRGWRDVGGVTHAGSREAAERAAQIAVQTLEGVARRALPPDVAEELTRGLRATALSGIANAFARVPRELSQRVYRNGAVSSGAVERIIMEGLASGLSARELAQQAFEYVSPSTPGGASYAAMRLARTEINNAFHEQQRNGGDRPGITAMRWNLSGSHKIPDECNIYATQDLYGLGSGRYPHGKVPDKPHPQCFCYLTYETMNPEQFRIALDSGSFDDELDRRTKENLARLQQKATKTDKPAEPETNNEELVKSIQEDFAKGKKIEVIERRIRKQYGMPAREATKLIQDVYTGKVGTTPQAAVPKPKVEAPKERIFKPITPADAMRGYGVTRSGRGAREVYEYSTDAYLDVNGWLRKGRVDEDGEYTLSQVRSMVKAIDGTMKPLTTDVELYRKTSVASFGGSKMDSLVGKEFVDKAFLSTTIDPDNDVLSDVNSGSILLRIRAKVGTKVSYIDQASGNQGEREMLVNRGTRYRVTAVQRTGDGKWLVDAETI